MQKIYPLDPGKVPSCEELDEILNLPGEKEFNSITFGILSNFFDGSKFTYSKSKVIDRSNLHPNALKNIKPVILKQIRNLITECNLKLKTSNATKNNFNETLYIRVEIPNQIDTLLQCKHPLLAEAKLVSNRTKIVSTDSVKFLSEEISNLQFALLENYILQLENLAKKLFEDSPELDFIVFSRFADTVEFYSVEYEFPNGMVKFKKENHKVANEFDMTFLTLLYNLFWFRNGKIVYGKTDDIISQVSQNYKKYIETQGFLSKKDLIKTIISVEKSYFENKKEMIIETV
jgi:hypothetical protein